MTPRPIPYGERGFHWSAQETKRLAELWSDPTLSATAIAHRLSAEFRTRRSASSVLGYAHRNGLPLRHPWKTKAAQAGASARRKAAT